MAFLIGNKTVEYEFVVKRLKPSGLTNREGAVIMMVRKTAGARVSEVRCDRKADAFWMQASVSLAVVIIREFFLPLGKSNLDICRPSRIATIKALLRI